MRMQESRDDMRKKVLLIILGIIIVFLTTCVIFMVYRFNNLDVKEKNSFHVKASDGTKFKVVYTLRNFPDESYDVSVIGHSNDKATIFSGDGTGSEDVSIDFICENGPYKYYIAYQNENKRLFVCSKSKKLGIMTDGSYIESYSDTILFSDNQDDSSYEVFTPIAKNQIRKNQGDYVIAYAEVLIQNGEEEILDKIKYFVSKPEKIECNFYTQEEILAKCNELLQKYGGV